MFNKKSSCKSSVQLLVKQNSMLNETDKREIATCDQLFLKERKLFVIK